MRFSLVLIWITALCLCAQGQKTPPPGKDAPASEVKGMAPRGTPADYQAQAHAGTVTIGAEFMRHAIPTPVGELSTEDYVIVEIGLFGAPGERIKLSISDFTLRINGKKAALASVPYGMVLPSVKDPQWEPPIPAGPKTKGGGLSTGGGGGQGESNLPPAPVHMTMPEQRAMDQKVQKGALPEGDRALPQAGLLFFPYRGKSQGIQSVDLIYAGPAGKVTLSLQP